MNVGDEEEHAVLLTNFFLGIGKKAWLIIGKSIITCGILLITGRSCHGCNDNCSWILKHLY